MKLNNAPMTNSNGFLIRMIFPFMLLTVLLLVSCKTDTSSRAYTQAPIAETEFVKILVDVRLAESIIRKQSSKVENTENITRQLYASIFEKYGITQDDFESSIKLYSSNPDKMYDINEKVVEKLSKLESEVKSQKSVEEPPISE